MVSGLKAKEVVWKYMEDVLDVPHSPIPILFNKTISQSLPKCGNQIFVFSML